MFLLFLMFFFYVISKSQGSGKAPRSNFGHRFRYLKNVFLKTHNNGRNTQARYYPNLT